MAYSVTIFLLNKLHTSADEIDVKELAADEADEHCRQTDGIKVNYWSSKTSHQRPILPAKVSLTVSMQEYLCHRQNYFIQSYFELNTV